MPLLALSLLFGFIFDDIFLLVISGTDFPRLGGGDLSAGFEVCIEKFFSQGRGADGVVARVIYDLLLDL